MYSHCIVIGYNCPSIVSRTANKGRYRYKLLLQLPLEHLKNVKLYLLSQPSKLKRILQPSKLKRQVFKNRSQTKVLISDLELRTWLQTDYMPIYHPLLCSKVRALSFLPLCLFLSPLFREAVCWDRWATSFATIISRAYKLKVTIGDDAARFKELIKVLIFSKVKLCKLSQND